MAATSAGTSAGRGTDAVHAGVDLDVDVEAGRAGGGERVERRRGVVTVGVSRLATIVGGVLGRLLAERRGSGASMPGLAQRDALLGEGDAQARAPGVERGPATATAPWP